MQVIMYWTSKEDQASFALGIPEVHEEREVLYRCDACEVG